MLSDENQNTWNAWKLLSDWHWYCKPFQWGQCQGVTTGTTGGQCVWQQSQVESCRVEVCDRQWSGCDRPWERRRWNSRGSSIADIGRGSIIIAREDNLGSYSRHICRQTRSTSCLSAFKYSLFSIDYWDNWRQCKTLISELWPKTSSGSVRPEKCQCQQQAVQFWISDVLCGLDRMWLIHIKGKIKVKHKRWAGKCNLIESGLHRCTSRCKYMYNQGNEAWDGWQGWHIYALCSSVE